MCSTLGRVSFMILMLRLFGNTKARRWFLYFLMAEQLIVNLFTSITIFTQCGNVLSLWDPVGHPSKCWSPAVQTDTGYVQGGNYSTDSRSGSMLIILQFSTQRLTLSWRLCHCQFSGLYKWTWKLKWASPASLDSVSCTSYWFLLPCYHWC